MKYLRSNLTDSTASQASLKRASEQPFFSIQFIGVMMLCMMAAMIWRATRTYPLPLFDLYPLYYGAKAWLHTGNAYALETVVPAFDHSFGVFKIGNGYPLPAVLIVLPLSLLPPQLAATIWVGLLTAGLLLALRLHRSYWLLLYVPVLEGLRIEQYTVFILIIQLVALWAYHQRRAWLLAGCCALILTKPTQGLCFAVLLMFLARNWRQQFIVILVVWGGSLLLAPTWPREWAAAASGYANAAQQPILWPFALLIIPLLLSKDVIGCAVLLQLTLVPFPGVYAASALSIHLLNDQRTKWLMVVSFLWPLPALLIGKAWATALTLMLPMILLTLLRWYEQKHALQGP